MWLERIADMTGYRSRRRLSASRSKWIEFKLNGIQRELDSVSAIHLATDENSFGLISKSCKGVHSGPARILLSFCELVHEMRIS